MSPLKLLRYCMISAPQLKLSNDQFVLDEIFGGLDNISKEMRTEKL